MSFLDNFKAMGHTIAYYPSFNHITGDPLASILLRQMIFWEDHENSEDGFARSEDEMAIDLGFSKKTLQTAKKKLLVQSLIIQTTKGLPRRCFYKVNKEQFDLLWSKYQSDRISKMTQARKEKSDRLNKQCLLENSSSAYQEQLTTTHVSAIESDSPVVPNRNNWQCLIGTTGNACQEQPAMPDRNDILYTKNLKKEIRKEKEKETDRPEKSEPSLSQDPIACEVIEGELVESEPQRSGTEYGNDSAIQLTALSKNSGHDASSGFSPMKVKADRWRIGADCPVSECLGGERASYDDNWNNHALLSELRMQFPGHAYPILCLIGMEKVWKGNQRNDWHPMLIETAIPRTQNKTIAAGKNYITRIVTRIADGTPGAIAELESLIESAAEFEANPIQAQVAQMSEPNRKRAEISLSIKRALDEAEAKRARKTG